MNDLLQTKSLNSFYSNSLSTTNIFLKDITNILHEEIIIVCIILFTLIYLLFSLMFLIFSNLLLHISAKLYLLEIEYLLS